MGRHSLGLTAEEMKERKRKQNKKCENRMVKYCEFCNLTVIRKGFPKHLLSSKHKLVVANLELNNLKQNLKTWGQNPKSGAESLNAKLKVKLNPVEMTFFSNGTKKSRLKNDNRET